MEKQRGNDFGQKNNVFFTPKMPKIYVTSLTRANGTTTYNFKQKIQAVMEKQPSQDFHKIWGKKTCFSHKKYLKYV